MGQRTDQQTNRPIPIKLIGMDLDIDIDMDIDRYRYGDGMYLDFTATSVCVNIISSCETKERTTDKRATNAHSVS